MSYIIYLVKDQETEMPLKVGCTSRPKKRFRENKYFYRTKHKTIVDIEILDMHDIIEYADILENEYSKLYGFGEIPTRDRFTLRMDTAAKIKSEKLINKTVSKEHRESLSKMNSGKGNPNYGSGKLFKELTTGFIGTQTDIESRFPIAKNSLCSHYTKSGKPISRGKNKGLHFVVWEDKK